MPLTLCLWTLAIAVPAGLLADWAGCSPAWLPRIRDLVAAARRRVAERRPRARVLDLPLGGLRGARRRGFAAAAGVATVAGVGGGMAVRLLVTLALLGLHLAGVWWVGPVAGVASSLAIAAVALAWWHADARRVAIGGVR